MAGRLAVCVDFGSTFTKATLIDLVEGQVLASASHPTTLGTDVLDGYDDCLAQLSRVDADAARAQVLACSSAGGGLRIAVVGNEELVTAEAGRRVALSSGGSVVAVLAASRALPEAAALSAAAPDVVLLTGGTDGGNAEALLGCARALVAAGWRGPVVVAGNVEAQPEVAEILGAAGVPSVRAANVVPRIGVLTPESARAAIRSMFLSHVIGGKHLSARAEFTAMVRGATPDVVLTGVELLARGLDEEHPGAGDVAVVDVGGATTDVYSVLEVDPDSAHSGSAGLSREVVATTGVARTVEGDLGMRWSAPSTVAAAGLVHLVGPAARRRDDPGALPGDEQGAAVDEAIARAAVGLALRRHAGRSRVVLGPQGRVVERTGADLREVALLVASGGVLRHGRPGVAQRVLAGSTGTEVDGGWQLPGAPRVVVDTDCVLAWTGLLAADHPGTAYRLARGMLLARDG
ncbi:glutamate mutase L [Nocardioides houyundeii]|uniref:glutamate mutase L n=1 Tax=Nocardioides houyundeii TaxID=2045452 RepID=UPI000DF19D54|nr:glutamate mutase L [Nocardioides houyundeii]